MIFDEVFALLSDYACVSHRNNTEEGHWHYSFASEIGCAMTGNFDTTMEIPG